MAQYDFCGYVTKNNVECADGRIIRPNAFAHHDGQVVPLVYNHQHDDINNVLGNIMLENRPDGVYGYGSFNNSEAGLMAKEAVMHGDIDSLSIYANKLKERVSGNTREVMHGVIREVSLVLAGANPGAHIMDVSVSHSADGSYEAWIFSGEPLDEIVHSEEGGEEYYESEEDEMGNDDMTVEEVIDTMNEDQQDVLYALVGQALEDGAEEFEDEEEFEGEEGDDEEYEEYEDDVDDEEYEEGDEFEHSADETTIKDVIETMNKEQKAVLYALVGQALEAAADEDDEENDMKHNAFDDEYMYEEDGTMEHGFSMDDLNEAIGDAKNYRTMKEAFLAHGIDDLRIEGDETYGVKGISALYPDARALANTPDFIKDDQAWVADVLANVKTTPFSRVKTLFADITADEARAKGYTKGKKKVEEVITLLKRVTNPTTIYKKQKIDRDDMLDIIDFDAIVWLKGEMKLKLNEEKARAILIGDGRSVSDNDKIDENCIRPIWTDNDLFTIKATVNVPTGADDDTKAREFIKTVIKTRSEYKGTGNPTLYTTEDTLAALLLIEDKNGRFIYTSEQQLASTLRVKKIVTVPPMEGLKDAENHPLMGIIVNLADYNVGRDKGGEENFFDDFDIDYNQMKYLIETRYSGAMVKPYSAMVFHMVEA